MISQSKQNSDEFIFTYVRLFSAIEKFYLKRERCVTETVLNKVIKLIAVLLSQIHWSVLQTLMIDIGCGTAVCLTLSYCFQQHYLVNFSIENLSFFSLFITQFCCLHVKFIWDIRLLSFDSKYVGLVNSMHYMTNNL